MSPLFKMLCLLITYQMPPLVRIPPALCLNLLTSILIDPLLRLICPRNYRFYRNGNFCKGTQVCNIIAETKVAVCGMLLKKSTGFSRMSVTASLLCFVCVAAK